MQAKTQPIKGVSIGANKQNRQTRLWLVSNNGSFVFEQRAIAKVAAKAKQGKCIQQSA